MTKIEQIKWLREQYPKREMHGLPGSFTPELTLRDAKEAVEQVGEYKYDRSIAIDEWLNNEGRKLYRVQRGPGGYNRPEIMHALQQRFSMTDETARGIVTRFFGR